jgi:hypothetical protein
MLADVAAQLLALLGREAALPRFPVLRTLLLAALEVFIPSEFALLRPLETTWLITACRLCVSRQARCHRHENARDECQIIHSIILSSHKRLRLAHSEAAFRIMRFLMHADKRGFHCALL